MSIDQDVTGICVCFNTKDLMERAFTSIRHFHPTMKIVIVDNSNRMDSCYKYVNTIVSANTYVIHTNSNIGHGKGLVLAMKKVVTPYVLAFDSDIEMLKSPVQDMLDKMQDDTWGVGYIEKTDLGGFDFGARPNEMKHGAMKYMHPYFQLVQVKEYKKYDPYIHHGAPCVATMLDIHKKGLSDKVLVEFEGLGHSSGTGFAWTSAPREFIRHDVAGTRNMNTQNGRPEIEGSWEYPNKDKKYTDVAIKEVESKENEKITVVTLTGDRPVCLSLLQKWIKNQTVQPDQWLVVDDGKHPYAPSIDCDYIRRVRTSLDPKFTLCVNMKVAMDNIKNDKIIFMEDDEYYAPMYIETMARKLTNYQVVGIGKSKYYYLPTQTYHRHANSDHASLAQTGIRYSWLNILASLLKGDSFLDMRIWGSVGNIFKLNWEDAAVDLSKGREINKKGYLFVDQDDDSLYCGIKGMAGRRGIGSGHQGLTHKDVGYNIFKKWVKNDYRDYLKLIEITGGK